MKKNIIRFSHIIPLLLICVVLFSCGPSINSFIVQPLTISSDDSVRINWDVTGTPTMLVKEQKVLDDLGNVQIGEVAPRYMNYTLAVERGGEEIYRTIQVTIYPKMFTNEIIMETISRVGDTIIAKDIKNPERWGTLYEVYSVSTGSSRELFVLHGGRSTLVDAQGTPSIELQGTPIEGDWEIRAILTEDELRDISTAPTSLSVKAVIKYKKR